MLQRIHINLKTKIFFVTEQRSNILVARVLNQTLCMGSYAVTPQDLYLSMLL